MISILTGDALQQLRQLPANCVHMCVTSPPYFGLRDYKAAGQIGLEASPDAFIAAIIEVFREVRRVLRTDGTCWVNLGDSYARTPTTNVPQTKNPRVSFPDHARTGSSDGHVRRGDRPGSRLAAQGLKPKDLLMMPARVAIALQADGWWLRSDIIWHKPNPMPESISDRPTSAHEHIFLLAKDEQYFFDAEAVKESSSGTARPRGKGVNPKAGDGRGIKQNSSFSAAVTGLVATRNTRTVWEVDELEDAHEHVLMLAKSERYFYDHEAIREKAVSEKPAGNGFNRAEQRTYQSDGVSRSSPKPWTDVGGTRNARNVWSIQSVPFKGAHFATFPPELARRCIAAGTSECGACATCSAPFKRVIEKGAPDLELQRRSGGDANGQYAGQSTKDHDAAGVQNASDVKRRILAGMVERRTVGWIPTCECPGAYPVPPLVLDPFFGAGTTGLVADRMGRDCLGIELNADYVQMAAARLRTAGGHVVC